MRLGRLELVHKDYDMGLWAMVRKPLTPLVSGCLFFRVHSGAEQEEVTHSRAKCSKDFGHFIMTCLEAKPLKPTISARTPHIRLSEPSPFPVLKTLQTPRKREIETGQKLQELPALRLFPQRLLDDQRL